MSLPESFAGGDPADSTVMSLLRDIAESRAEPEERKHLLEWLSIVEARGNGGDGPLLIAFAVPDDGGPLASVTVNTGLLQNLLVFTDGDSSMTAVVDEFYAGLDQEDRQIIDLKASEATVVVRPRGLGGDAPAELTLIKVSGDIFYHITYRCREASWDVWSKTFEDSSRSLRLSPPSA